MSSREERVHEDEDGYIVLEVETLSFKAVVLAVIVGSGIARLLYELILWLFSGTA